VTVEVLAADRPPATAVSAAAARSSADVLSDVGVVDGIASWEDLQIAADVERALVPGSRS